MRWGIFWRKMSFDIFLVGDIVAASFLLHNFLVDERERIGSYAEDANFFRTFSLQEHDARSATSFEVPSPVATDNNEPRPNGRAPGISNLYEEGRILRESLCASLTTAGLGRRYTEDMKFNEYGQVYF